MSEECGAPAYDGAAELPPPTSLTRLDPPHQESSSSSTPQAQVDALKASVTILEQDHIPKLADVKQHIASLEIQTQTRSDKDDEIAQLEAKDEVLSKEKEYWRSRPSNMYASSKCKKVA